MAIAEPAVRTNGRTGPQKFGNLKTVLNIRVLACDVNALLIQVSNSVQYPVDISGFVHVAVS